VREFGTGRSGSKPNEVVNPEGSVNQRAREFGREIGPRADPAALSVGKRRTLGTRRSWRKLLRRLRKNENTESKNSRRRGLTPWVGGNSANRKSSPKGTLFVTMRAGSRLNSQTPGRHFPARLPNFARSRQQDLRPAPLYFARIYLLHRAQTLCGHRAQLMICAFGNALWNCKSDLERVLKCNSFSPSGVTSG